MTPAFEPHIIRIDDTALGHRFVLHHAPPHTQVRGLVVHAQPFAEEINKARRMTAMQSRALAEAGFAVARIDLLGCGDSAGDFGDATWARWIDDIVAAVHWLQNRHPVAEGHGPRPLWLWGLRAGTLLTAAASARLATEGQRCHFLFWQPAPQGKLLLQQFLRLKAAGELLAGQTKVAMEQLRAELAARRPVEVAGYTLNPLLCEGLEQATLQPPAALPPGRLVWLEVSPVEHPTLAPAGASTLAAWRAAGWAVHAQALRGPAFWQTTEIEDAPALIDATLAALSTAAAGTDHAAHQPAEAAAA